MHQLSCFTGEGQTVHGCNGVSGLVEHNTAALGVTGMHGYLVSCSLQQMSAGMGYRVGPI